MAKRSDTGKQRSQHESTTSPSGALVGGIQALSISDPHLEPAERTGQRGHQECFAPGGQPQHVPSTVGSVTHADENEAVITSIRATDVALGLRRLPAGFYAVVHHSGLEWRTENRRPSVHDDDLEWRGPIPIPSDASAAVCLEVYASFEIQPMLGAGELLRKLTITAEKLLDRSARGVPFTPFPKDGGVVSPCSSILVTIRRRMHGSARSSALTGLRPHFPTSDSRGELEDVTDQGHSALSRYRKCGSKSDLDCAIEEFERALYICPLDHPSRAAAQSNLAMARFILSQVEDIDTSLEVPLSLYGDALASRPVTHVDRPSTLIQLAIVHFARFQKLRDEVEVARAEALLQEAARLSPTDSYENQTATFMLQLHDGPRTGVLQADDRSLVEQVPASHSIDEDPWKSSVRLLRRFEEAGDPSDLQRAIILLEDLLRSTSIWDSRYYAVLGNLGVALLYRSNHLGNISDLEDAISRYRDALDLTPDGHPYKHDLLNNLGNSLFTRFERLGELSDLEDAILMLELVADLTPHDQPDRPCILNSLGNALTARFVRIGELSNLEDAISMFRAAVDLTSHRDRQKPTFLHNLGNSLFVRFKLLGEISNLEHAISMLKDAVDLTPHGHPKKPSYLSSLGTLCKARFQHLGKLSDLEDAILVLKDAMQLSHRDHPEQPVLLNHLGNSLLSRFKCLGELRDLQDAILMLRDAVRLVPHGYTYRPAFLYNLGNSLITRFRCIGELSDLEAAISTFRGAVDITPSDHPDKPVHLNALGNSLQARFERLGELTDIEESISTLQDVVDLTPHGHLNKATFLDDLGISLTARFNRLGRLSDLENAISSHKDAVHLTPHGHPAEAGRLNNLGTCFKTRFEHFGELSDLETAISMLRDVGARRL